MAFLNVSAGAWGFDFIGMCTTEHQDGLGAQSWAEQWQGKYKHRLGGSWPEVSILACSWAPRRSGATSKFTRQICVNTSAREERAMPGKSENPLPICVLLCHHTHAHTPQEDCLYPVLQIRKQKPREIASSDSRVRAKPVFFLCLEKSAVLLE